MSGYWKPEQDQMIIDLRGEKMPWNDIAIRVGRSVEACSARYRGLLPKEKRVLFYRRKTWSDKDDATLGALLEERRTLIQIARIMQRTRGVISYRIEVLRKPVNGHSIAPKIHVPSHLVADRDRRLAAERDLTSMFCGDPAPGQSALDRKRQEFA